MFFKVRPALTLAFAFSLLLGGCESASDAKKAPSHPVPLQKVEAAPAHSVAPLNESDKISKLEQQVADLQKEVAASRPKIAKIDVMEQKFKDLSLGLEKIDATYNMKPTPVVMAPPAPVALPVPSAPTVADQPLKPADIALPPPKPPESPKAPEVKPPVEAPKPVAKAEVPLPAGAKEVKDLRIGEKKEFSRLVLDLGQPVKVNYDIDNDEKIMVVDVPGFKWAGAKAKSFPTSQLISSYQVTEDDKGSHLVVQLKKAAKVTNYSNIDPTGGKLARAVLDVSPQ